METTLIYISILMALLLSVYLKQIYFFYNGLLKISIGNNELLHSVTVIVPARNEEQNIERCLNSILQQNYPKEKLSIIVIDDQSTDNTYDIIKNISQASPIRITIFKADSHPEILSPKIRALIHGIQHTSSTIIALTDADCVAHHNWVQTLVSHFSENVGVVTGVTKYEKTKNISTIFWGIQYLDFLSYSAIAAGALGQNRVLVSNGSNMAFRRVAFDTSDGCESLKNINSGEDSLLAQMITKNGIWKAGFVYESGGAITTQPAYSWKQFYHQRARWVGQTAYYPSDILFFMICTFILFVLVTVSLPLTFFHWNVLPWIILSVKFFGDYLLMQRFTTLINAKNVLRYFIPTAIIHIPYILASTIGGYFFSFEWKGRTMKKETTA